jgi:ABC-2 type transport system ATP-binding protein
MHMEEAAVSVKGLVKRYGSVTAVDGISFEVKKGEVFGLLGSNGAGKTTTFECMEGLRTTDGGVIKVAGCDPVRQQSLLHSRLGVQLQSSSLPDSMLVSEIIRLVCTYHHTAVPDELVRKFGAEPLLRKQYRQLSTGQKRRVHLVLALCSNPQVLILDEPTAGLDVQNRAGLHDEIRKASQEGMTILLATHDMAEAETLCGRIAILVKGKIAVCGTPSEITAAGSRQTKIRLRTSAGSLFSAMPEIADAQYTETKDGYIEWSCRNASSAVIEILTCVKNNGDTVEDLRVERPSLEERFLELVEDPV